MFELLMALRKKKAAPGNQTLVAGDSTIGYYGTVSSANFFTATEAAAAIGLTTGTVMNNTTDWFKFSWQGRILYIPKTPIRQSLAWNDLNVLKAVTLAQNKRVTKFGRQFIVRLIKTLPEGTSVYTGSNNVADPAGAVNSEYDSLIYRVCATNPASQVGTNFENFTQTELGFIGTSTTPGGNTLCQETSASPAPVGICTRGNAASDFSTIHLPAATYVDSVRGWRPVFELVGT